MSAIFFFHFILLLILPQMNKKANPWLFLCSPCSCEKGKMQVARPVVNFYHAVFVFVDIGLSPVLFVRSIEGNGAVLKNVNYSVSYHTSLDYYREVKQFKDYEWGRYRLRKGLVSELTCSFIIFQCNIGCQCDLAATNITITCPGGYPPGYVSSSPSNLLDEDKDLTPLSGFKALANASFFSSHSKSSQFYYFIIWHIQLHTTILTLYLLNVNRSDYSSLSSSSYCSIGK